MDNFDDFDFDLIALEQDFAFAGSNEWTEESQADLKQIEVSACQPLDLLSSWTPRTNKRPSGEALGDREGCIKRRSPPDAACSTPAAVLLDTARIAHRKEIVSLLFKYWLTDFDVRNLARHMSRHCDPQVMYISPSIRDPVFGITDMFTLFILWMETFPDAISLIHSIDVEEDNVVVVFSFQGTKVYPTPIATAFKQLKAHLQVTSTTSRMARGTSSASNAFMAFIAQKIRPMVVAGFEPCKRLSADSSASTSSVVQVMDSYLRTAPVENAVLKGGPMSFTKQVNFCFDGYDRILRIISFNV